MHLVPGRKYTAINVFARGFEARFIRETKYRYYVTDLRTDKVRSLSKVWWTLFAVYFGA